MSNLTPAYFLLALIGCISGQFEEQVPHEIVRKSRSKRVGCTVDASVPLSTTAIHWYRQKPGEAFQRILYFADGASKATNEPEFSSRFNGGKMGRIFSVTISGATDGDAATYYCALWREDTVTDPPVTAVQKPRASFLHRKTPRTPTSDIISTL